MDPEQERIRGYLQAQAAKLTIPQLVERIRSDMSQVQQALATVPASRFEERPGADDWSANEVANHLTATSRQVCDGIRAVLDGGERPAPVADQIRSAGTVKDAAGWWDALSADREALFARVLAASGDEHLEIVWQHPFFGDLNWREWLLFTRLHDLDHARQMLSIAETLTAN